METPTTPDVRTDAARLSIAFSYGTTMPFEELPPNSIALDGAVQGPALDPTWRRFSFDHHGGCIRLVTLATCEQVLVALDLGLVVDRETVVFVNDIDADTVLSCVLLERALKDGHSPRLTGRHLRELVRSIGRTDAHGPQFTPHPLMESLKPERGVPQNESILRAAMQEANDYIAGLYRFDSIWDERAHAPRPGQGFAIDAHSNEWDAVTTFDGFAELYQLGYLAVALYEPGADGSHVWTIGKKSDLVPLALGPADDSPGRIGSYTNTILGQLAREEAEAFNIDPRANWGGGTSIGGSPRLPEGVGSRLPLLKVREILDRFLIAK